MKKCDDPNCIVCNKQDSNMIPIGEHPCLEHGYTLVSIPSILNESKEA